MKKQLLSIILVLSVLIGIMPYTAFSEDIGPNSSQADFYGDFIDGQQVISDMIEKNGMFAHPRIIMSDERFTKLKAHIGDDSVTAILLEKLRSEADRLLDTSVTVITESSLSILRIPRIQRYL